MLTLSEGHLILTFPDGWEVSKYDDWDFYLRFREIHKPTKAIDFLVFDPTEKELWLLELKDHRQFPRNKTIEFWDEMALKSRDTLAGVWAASLNNTHAETAFARRALSARKLHVVLHLEQSAKPSKLFPRVADRANVQQKLKQIIKPIDAHPQVIELSAMGTVPWTARSGTAV